MRKLIFTTTLLTLSTLIAVSGVYLFPQSHAHSEEKKANPFDMPYLNGVNHAHAHRMTTGYGSASSLEKLKRLKTYNINAIAITPFAYQRKHTDNTIAGYSGKPEGPHRFGFVDRTMTDDKVIKEIRQAKALGMTVMMKPHIWSHDFWDQSNGAWHGTVHQKTQKDHEKWFDAYTAYILHYAKICEAEKVEWLCIGTELVKMTTDYPKDWPKLIKEVRKVYKGKLTYSTHWYKEFEKITWWDQVDAIGIGAYFPLDLPAGASLEDMKKAWQKHLPAIEAVAQKYKKPILFTEQGYRPVKEAHITPWTYSGGTIDYEHQKRCFEAFYQVFQDKPWFRGVFWWKTFTDNRKEKDGFTFMNRPAKDVVKAWGEKMKTN